MTRRNVARVLSVVMLFATGATGLYNGLRELGYTLTPLQRSVSIGVLVYGVLGIAAGVALVARHPSSIWLAALWGLVVVYVSAVAAIAYAGSDASVVGAIASGMASGLIAAGVIWSARTSARRPTGPEIRRPTQTAVVVALLLAGMSGLEACRQLYSGPPVVRERDGTWATKRVRAKREPDRLIAEDLSVCWVVPQVFANIKPGDSWRCDWRHVPTGQ
jgi:hypothetical protein